MESNCIQINQLTKLLSPNQSIKVHATRDGMNAA